MKDLIAVQFDPDRCRQELLAFKGLLDGKSELGENADIKPFFEAHHQLAVFTGSYHWSVAHYDRLAFQYQLFGDFTCDLVVGDSACKAFGFIEWEAGTATGVFKRQGEKATPEWATRFERGFSQIIDWFCKMDDMAHTDEFEARFGARHIEYFGLLVAGRDEWLSHPRERRRWEWRSQKVLVNGRAIRCVTYDQLHQFLSAKINAFYPLTGQAVGQGSESRKSSKEP